MNKKEMTPAIEHSLLNQMMSVGKTVLMILDKRLEPVELSAAKLWTLVWVASLDAPPTLTELADCMQSAKSNITTMVDRLEKEGMVQRIKDPQDRRVVLIEMTPTGREHYEAGVAVFYQLNQELMDLFGVDVQAQFRQILETMDRNLSE